MVEKTAVKQKVRGRGVVARNIPSVMKRVVLLIVSRGWPSISSHVVAALEVLALVF